jgi:hypothetical protein
MDFDYKKYSLENLEKWMSDALLSSEATPQEIYDVIKGVVDEEYHYFKHRTGRCYELLALLNGNGSLLEQVKAQGDVWDKEDVEAILAEREYYEPSMPPWGHSDMEYLVNQSKVKSCDKDDKPSKYQKALYDFWQDNNSSEESSQYTEEELNVMCDAAEDKEKCREYNLREAEYYDKRTKLDVEYEEIMKSGGYDWTPEIKKDKVIKWQLPIEVDGISGEYYVQFPDDLMEAANIKEDDLVEWIDRGDGGFELRKVTKPLGLDEC